MKKTGAAAALLTPAAEGWRVRLPGGAGQNAQTLAEAAAAVPANHDIHLALPGHLVLLERLTLPSTDRAELAGMLQLQLEKTLPYPMDEVSSDFEILSQTETESTLLSVAANAAQLDQLCEPLRSTERLPLKITLYAMHVAASCPPDAVVLCLWPEEGQLEAAICENGKLGFAQTLPNSDPETVLAELPHMLLSAEMEGVPTEFASIRLEQGCAHLREPLGQFFGKPVEVISFDTPLPEPSGNLLPAAWVAETRRLQRAGRLRQRLQMAAVVYLLLVAAAFIYLAWQKNRVRKLDAEMADLRPKVELIQTRQDRWLALAPAVDPSRYTVEILHLIHKNLPSEEVKITVFNHVNTPEKSEFTVKGEAPNADLAFEIGERIRAEAGLADFAITAANPIPLPSGVTFIVTGKLR